MLPEQRRRKMARMIAEHNVVNTRELADSLGISQMTVRRDLKLLEQRNVLRTTWGGAVPSAFQAHDIPYGDKAAHMPEAKRAIARAALELIEDDTCVILDAGTTTLELAKLLFNRRLTVVTTDLQIGLLLAQAPHVDVHLTGGRIDPVSGGCLGTHALECLGSIHATVAFIGTNVWDPAQGVTTSSAEKMHLKRRMMERACRGVLLADSSKYGNFSTWRLAGLDGFSWLITDNGLAPEARAEATAAGASLRIAE